MNESSALRVLAIDPFHGGSHRAFLSGLVEHSRHSWRLITGKPVHWKWRMRSATLEMAELAAREIASEGYPDVILCSDMLDLPCWLGLVGRLACGPGNWSKVPIVTPPIVTPAVSPLSSHD